MPDVSKKISRMLERGFDFFKDKGRFRHVKDNNLRYQDPSNHPSAKYASQVAHKLHNKFREYGFPRIPEELEECCQEAYQDVAEPLLVASNPTISLRKVMGKLPDYARSRATDLGENSEPYFTRTLSGEPLKESLHLINNLNMNQKSIVISVLDQACKTGVPVENVIKEIESDENVRTTVGIREKFCSV